jgi:hypothetical protein
MNLIRRTLEIDETTDARLTEIAAERGQDVATVLADAVALLDSVVDLAVPTSLRIAASSTTSSRPDKLSRWATSGRVASWDTMDELPPPSPRKIG